MRELRDQHLVIMSSVTEKAEYKKATEVEEYDTMSDWIRDALKERIKHGKRKR